MLPDLGEFGKLVFRSLCSNFVSPPAGSPVFKVMFRGPLSEFRRSGGGAGSDLTADESANSATTSLISSTAQAATAGSLAAAGAYSASSAFGGISNSEAVRRRTTVAVSDVDGRAFDILLRYVKIIKSALNQIEFITMTLVQ